MGEKSSLEYITTRNMWGRISSLKALERYLIPVRSPAMLTCVKSYSVMFMLFMTLFQQPPKVSTCKIVHANFVRR